MVPILLLCPKYGESPKGSIHNKPKCDKISADIIFALPSFPVFLPVLIAVINSLTVKATTSFVRVFSTSKIMAVVLVAVVGVVFTLHNGAYPEVFSHPFRTIEGHVTSPATVALAMYGVLWSYDGW